MKVIILGTGSMGAAACAHLARLGHEVLGIDRFAPPHGMGSHHGESRMIRQSYGEHHDYVPLLLRAYELWRELEQASGERILFETGGLYMGPPSAPMVDGSIGAARRYDLPHEELDADEIRRRFPVFRIPDGFRGIYEQRAGFLVPEKAIAAYRHVASRHGVRLLDEQEVLGWDCSAAGISVRTANAVHQADRLVITAGAWAGSCLGDIGVPLEVTRQVLAWVRVDDHPMRASLESMPGWFRETDRPGGFYGFPLPKGGSELKFALHAPGRVIDPELFTNDGTDEEEVALHREFIHELLGVRPDGEIRSELCRYTNTPDGNFVIGLHPDDSRVSFAAGFSGHGFKFSSVVGEILAELAVEGGTNYSIGLLSPGRFLREGC